VGKDKLKRFAEMASFKRVIQPSREETENGIALRGKWGSDFFKNEQPIILELGCGHGDYTVNMARLRPDVNFIGVDVKGARIWRGAKDAETENLENVGFLRTQIELIDRCFGPDEIDEIWITFPDPQLKFRRAKHRLTHPLFLARYRNILKKAGFIHLKSDSEFLHGYTNGLLEMLGWPILESNHDIYRNTQRDPLLDIKTYYEKKWLEQGKAITYLKFQLGEPQE